MHVLHLFCRKHDLVLELRRMCCLFNILAPIATNRHRQKRNAFPGLVKFNIGNLLLQKKVRESSTSNIEEDWQKYLKVGSLYSAGKFKPNEFSNLCKLIKGNTRKINDPLKR